MKLCFKCLRINYKTKNFKTKLRPCYSCSQKHDVLFYKTWKEQKQPVSSSFLSYINGCSKTEDYLSDQIDTSEDSKSVLSNSKYNSQKDELILHGSSYNCETVSLSLLVEKNRSFSIPREITIENHCRFFCRAKVVALLDTEN